MKRIIASLALWLALLVGARAAENEPRIPLLVDTDVGSYLDDSLALSVLIASPQVDLRGIATCGGDTQTRAWIAGRLLHATGRDSTPVAYGRDPQPAGKVEALYQYRYHPAVLFNRSGKLAKDDPADLWAHELAAGPSPKTILALGPLTNIARLLEEHPDCKVKVERIVLMGGALEVGLDGPPARPEWNVKSDVPAARAVLASGVPLFVVPLDATRGVRLSAADCRQLFAAQTMLTQQLQAMHQMADEPEPAMHDAVAASLLLNDRLGSWKEARLTIDEDGLTRIVPGKSNCKIAVAARGNDVAKFCLERIASFGEKVAPREPRNFAEVVDRGGLPAKVHVFEDYETDIERRWWLSGKLLERSAAGNRAMHSVLTLDFDDLQGDLKTLYSAVVFNPVPGPPMGPRTRLAFRYRLTGTDTLRVQLYSLSNGYHRHLTLRGLPQDEWRAAAVDMTQMRRPDGTGGPLAADERIDDIQFYAAPTARFEIDDVVLYVAAPEAERRPFPKRFVFTGWFDTGKQGVEWPGDYEIVAHAEPRSWKCAKSIAHQETGRPWLRISFRGERPIGDVTVLRFDAKATGASECEVVLANSRSGQNVRRNLSLKPGAWQTHEIEFTRDGQTLGAADELQFHLAGGELLVDDVLLYEPGQQP